MVSFLASLMMTGVVDNDGEGQPTESEQLK